MIPKSLQLFGIMLQRRRLERPARPVAAIITRCDESLVIKFGQPYKEPGMIEA